MAGRCANFCKWGLLVFNILFLLGGLAVLGAGIYYYIKGPEYGVTVAVASGIITTAVFVIVFAILGIIAAARIVRVLLWTYFVLLVLLLIGQIVVAVVAYTNSNLLVDTLGSSYSSFDIQTRLNIENYWNCCGYNAYNDSAANGTCCLVYYNQTEGIAAPEDSPCLAPGTTDVQTCIVAYNNFYTTYYKYLMAGAGVLAGIEIFGLVFSATLACIREEVDSSKVEMDYR